MGGLNVPERKVDAVILAISKGVWRECCIMIAGCKLSARWLWMRVWGVSLVYTRFVVDS